MNRKSRKGPFVRFQSKGLMRENSEVRAGDVWVGWEWEGSWEEKVGMSGSCVRGLEGEEARSEEIMGVGQKVTKTSQSEEQHLPGKK